VDFQTASVHYHPLMDFQTAFFFIYAYCGALIDVPCRHGTAAAVVKGKTLMKLFRSVFIEDGRKSRHSHSCGLGSIWVPLKYQAS
jgi:hypothetical protein